MTALPNPETVFQAVFIPKQRPAPAEVSAEMTVFIATYPPLGQISHTQSSDVVFTAVLEIPQNLAAEPWQIVLWHSGNDGEEWAEAVFNPGEHRVQSRILNENSEVLGRLHFTTSALPVDSSMSFTVKFRQGPNHPWRWIREEMGLGDGMIVSNSVPIEEGDSEDLPDLIQNLNPSLSWKSHPSQCPNTRLWSVDANVDAAKDSPGERSTFANLPLGVPWGSFRKWFALVRLWHPWLAPRHGNSDFELDKDAILCSFLSPRGKHLVILAVSIGNVVTVLRSDSSGKVTIYLRNDALKPSKGTVLVAIGDSFESANAAVMYHARSLLSPVAVLATERAHGTQPSDGVEAQWYEDWYDGLGYCTWNALGQGMTHEQVLKALDDLANNSIRISSLIIDDGWQDIDYRGKGQWQHGWNSFEAEPKKYPKGLKGLISDIRSKHRSIQHINVWHALLGYWGGLAPGGELARKYKTVNVVRDDIDPRNLPIDSTMTVVAEEDVARFYCDFYQFLSSCGIDGVKTDGQYTIDTLVSAKARRDLIYTYLREWSHACLRSFSNKVISCMSQSPQMIFYSQLPSNKPAMVVRNSDDFFPEVPSSHPWHVWSNAYNSLLTMHLNVVPDWDMFQTVHQYSGFHAAARCISGGPVYITDVPGQHNVDLIKQMTGITTRGRTIVFRPSVVGRAIDPYTHYEDLSLLKIGAYHGRAATGTPIMGIFNVSAQSLTELVHLSCFSGVLPSLEYVVRSHQTGKVSLPLRQGLPTSLVIVSVGIHGYDILCAFPLAAFESKTRGQVRVTNFGLVGKMTGCAALLKTQYTVLGNGRLLVDTTMKALGILGLYISALPELSVEDDFMVTIQGRPVPPHTVSIDEADNRVFKVNTEMAWNEMGLEGGWSNEVQVKVYFRLEDKV